MRIISSKRLRNLAVATLSLAIAAAGAQLLTLDGKAAAYQPEGLRMYLAEAPEPPCPYGHDDGCENAPLSLPAVNPYASDNPHDLLPNGHAGHDTSSRPVSIEYYRQQLNDRQAQTGSGSIDGSDEPGGTGNDVNYAITSEIAGLPWAADGQTASEKLTLEWLGTLQEYNPSLVSALTKMPFLQDHTPGDRQAIQTLTLISEDDAEEATEIATYAGFGGDGGFADGGGIDNTEAKILAVMGILYSDGDTFTMRLLADDGTVEERSVVGRHGQPISFSIVRWLFEEQNSKLMETATTAVSDAETLMGKALPTDFVGILVEDLSGALAANNGISIQVDEGFDSTLLSAGYSDRFRQRTIAHEIGHYWWGQGEGVSHEAWISEGVAEYIGAYSVMKQFNDNDVATNYYPCPYYRTIEHLRADRPQYAVEPSYGSQCNYSLGERLFINLDRSMTRAAFDAALRNLHRRLSTYEQDEIDQGLSLWSAFCPVCAGNPRNLSSVGHTLARRYGEKVLTDSSAPTGSVPGLGVASNVSIVDFFNENRQYGVAQVPASSPDQRRWLQFLFSEAPNPPETVKIRVVQYHEDRQPYALWPQERRVFSRDGHFWFYAYLGNPPRRAAGHHWVYIYNEQDQKIASAEYQVLP